MTLKKIFGGLLTVVLAGSVLSIAPNTAIADIGPNPLVSLNIEKTFDGTGHGTDTATFMTSQNGFKPADDTATDNVVSSHDTVGYKMDLKIRAGTARTIVLDFSNNSLLNVDFDTFCYNFGAISAKKVNSTCELTVPSGASGSLTANIVATAADTAGTIERDQALNISYGIKDSKAYGNVSAEPVTIISAPRADLVIWPGTYPNKTAYKKNFSSAATGFFELIPQQLEYENTSSIKGVSTAGEYTATIDVSEWPATTVWTLGNTVIEVVDGKLNVKTTGKQKLSYNVPEGWEAAMPDFEKGSSRTLNISMVVDPNSFSSEDFKNNGTGFQPGDNKGQTETTFSSQYGSIAGSPFPNNDYSAIIINRESDPIAQVFSKKVFVPYSTGRSIFEDESRYWDEAQTEKESKNSSPQNVSLGTEFRQELFVYTKNLTEVPETTKVEFTVTDSWNASHQKLDSSRPITVENSEGKVINSNLYTITYSDTKDADHTNESLWSSTPSDNSQSLRVVFKSAIKHGATNGSNLKVIVHSIVNEDLTSTNWGEDADLIRDKFRGYLVGEEISETVEKESMIDGSVRAVWLGTPELELTHDNDVSLNEATPGSTINFEINRIRSSNIPVMSEGVPGKIELTLDNCISNPIFDSATQKNYTITYTPAIPGSDGKICNSVDATPGKVIFTGKTSENLKVSSKINDNGYVALPTIRYSVDISKSANGAVTNNAVFTWNDANAEVIPVSDESDVNVALTNATTQDINSISSKTEINKTVSFKVDTTDNNAEGKRGSVIVLPRNGDTVLLNDLEEDSRNDYLAAGFPEGSNFNGSYSVKNISIDASQSSDTVLYYTTDANPDLNYEGKNWYLVSEAGQNGNPSLSEATAVYLEMDTELGSNKNSTVLIDLDTTGNVKDDVYVLWSNGIRSGDNVVQPNPWPANAVVVSSSIAGTVWWDENRDSAITVDGDTPEAGIEGVTVSLFEADENGEPVGSAIATQVTDADGKYLFDSLNSGNYIVEIVDKGENLPESVTSEIYNNELDVEQTYSYRGKLYESSSLKSQIVKLGVDSNIAEVNYGFFKPSPIVDVDKEIKNLICLDVVCEVEFKITIKNSGNTDITNGTLTENMSSEFVNPEFVSGEFYDEKVTEVFHTFDSSYANTESGKAYSWGSNQQGRLGHGSASLNLSPAKEIKGLEGKTIKAAHHLNGATYLLTTSNEVYFVGSNPNGASGDPAVTSTSIAKIVPGLENESIVSVYSKPDGGYFVNDKGEVFAVGNNNSGSNGTGSTAARDEVVAKVLGLDGIKIDRVIPRGFNGAYFISDKGDVYSTGSAYGYLNGNNNNTTNLNIPELIQSLQDKNVKDIIDIGPSSYAFLTESGEVYTLGINNLGSLGNGTLNNGNTTPQKVVGLDGVNIKELYSRGQNGAYAISDSGQVYAWGANQTGTVGNGTADQYSPSAIQVKGIEGISIKKIKFYSLSGSSNALFLSDNGDVYTIGDGSKGALGTGSTTNLSVATKIAFPENEVIKDIFIHKNGGAAISAEGSFYTWGSGLTKDPSPNPILSPIKIQDFGADNIQYVSLLSDRYEIMTSDKTIYNLGVTYPTMAQETDDYNGGYWSESFTSVYGLTNIFNGENAISPKSLNENAGIKEYKLSIPKIPANSEIVLSVKATVSKSKEDKVYGNQAWFDSSKTPYSGVYGQEKPDAMIIPDYEFADSEGINGNATCNIGSGIEGQGQQTDSDIKIDMCDQIPVKIAATMKDLGSLTGTAWLDTDRNGTLGPTEPLKEGMKVTLLKEGVVIAETETDENGFYRFDGLQATSGYTVRFDVRDISDKDNKSYSPTTKNSTPALNKSVADKKTYTTNAVSIPVNGVREHMNIGLIENNPAITVNKTSDYGDPATISMNSDGKYIDTKTNTVIGDRIPVKVTITNSGNENLVNFQKEDIHVTGPKVPEDEWVCKVNGNNVTPTTIIYVGWKVNCTNYLTGLDAENDLHKDIFKVTASGENSSTTVSGEDPWSASFVENDPSWTVNKTSSIASGETIGTTDEVTYTLTAKNTGTVVLEDLVIKDMTKHVLDNSTLNTENLDSSFIQLEGDSNLYWVISKLAPSETATVSYTVKVNDVLSEDRVMLNYITDGGSSVKPDVCFDATEFDNINGPLYSMDDVDTTNLIEGCYTIHEVVDHNSPVLPSLGGKGVLNYIIIGTILLIVSAGVYFGMTRKSARN